MKKPIALTLTVLVVAILAGCVINPKWDRWMWGEPIQTYEGARLPDSEVATIREDDFYLPPHVCSVDQYRNEGRTDVWSGNIFPSASKARDLHVRPGMHLIRIGRCFDMNDLLGHYILSADVNFEEGHLYVLKAEWPISWFWEDKKVLWKLEDKTSNKTVIDWGDVGPCVKAYAHCQR